LRRILSRSPVPHGLSKPPSCPAGTLVMVWVGSYGKAGALPSELANFPHFHKCGADLATRLLPVAEHGNKGLPQGSNPGAVGGSMQAKARRLHCVPSTLGISLFC
jgi:hypothetical protein